MARERERKLVGGRRERVEEGSVPVRAVKAKNRSWPEASREGERERERVSLLRFFRSKIPPPIVFFSLLRVVSSSLRLTFNLSTAAGNKLLSSLYFSVR